MAKAPAHPFASTLKTFKTASGKSLEARPEDMQSLSAFQQKLAALGHFWTGYEDIEHLKRQFRDQLDKLLE